MKLYLPRSLPKAAFGAALAISLAQPALAGLGGAVDGNAIDRVRTGINHHVQASGAHIDHVLTLANGGTVHELANAQGQVYAVSWRGPGKPDLRTLLGNHFADYQNAAAQRPRRWMRMPVRVRSTQLVIETGGHPGAFWGVAYLPRNLPAGFSASELMQ